jgi:hypothetical protein
MILEFLLNAIKGVITLALGVIQIPPFPESFTNAIDSVLTVVFNNVGLLGLVVHWNTVKVGIPVLIAIANMDRIYSAVMWIIRKIPVAGMS